MGFNPSQAYAPFHPVPVTPSLARLCLRRWCQSMVWLLLLRTALLAAALPLLLTFVIDDGAARALPWVGLGALAGALAANAVFAGTLSRWAGWATPGWETTGGHATKVVPQLRGLGWTALWLSVALGLPLGYVGARLIGLLGGHLGPGVMVGASVAALALLTVLVRLPKHVAGFADVRHHHAHNATVRRTGSQTTASVEEVEFLDTWVGDLPIFDVRVRVNVAAKPVATLRLSEYPAWAPVPGNVFDVWRDPEAPDDPDRMVFERRLVGQSRVEDPMPLRRPAGSDEGPSLGPALPSWVEKEISENTRFRHFLGVLTAFAGIAAAVAACGLRLHHFTPDPPLVKTMMALLLACTLATAAAWLWPWFAPRRPPRTRIGPIWPGVLGIVIVFPLNFELSDQALHSGASTTLVVTIWLLYMAAGTLPFALMLAYPDHVVPAAMANSAQVDPALVTEALRSGDPEALRSGDPEALQRLRDEHGFYAGVLNLT